MDPAKLRPDLIETISIDDFTLRKEFGRERGLNPTPSEEQKKAVDKLNHQLQVKLRNKSKKDVRDVTETEIQFDLKSRPRVILWRGNVLKKHAHALASLTASEKRQAILLNDVLLITSDHSTGDWLLATEKLMLHQAIPLTDMAIRDLAKASTEEVDPSAFEIICLSDGTRLTLIAENPATKLIWLEEIEMAIFCLKSVDQYKNVGWQHEVIRHTLYSAAMLGDIMLLKKFITNKVNLDHPDESGMCALHWACLFGKKDAVVDLVEAGCELDPMNSGLNSPLLLASGMGHADITFYLIERGADVHCRNLRDMDCMFMCVLFGCTSTDLYDIIAVLQRRGVDINQQDSSGSSPLHQCANSGNPRPIQALVDSGADVNMKHGRNGMTPLQIACGTEHPDPETVRSLLDRGAHPNWRDVQGRTSFDLVLVNHQMKMGKAAQMVVDPKKTMEETLDEVQEFIQVCLPVLMELVRKGARYTPESILSLRPSFQEVINTGRTHWEGQVENAEFQDFVDVLPDQLASKQNWVEDHASLSCLLCVQKFTYSNRRHHCRICGALVCDMCSTKRVHTTKSASAVAAARSRNSTKQQGGRRSTSPVPPPSPTPSLSGNTGSAKKNPKDGDRVCDGCFNKLAHECFLWQQAVQKVRRAQEKLAAENPELLLNEASISGTEQSGGDMAASSSKAGVSGADRARNVATETRRALEQRGERLQQASERSEEMRQNAADFKDMTAQLLKQQKERARGWV